MGTLCILFAIIKMFMIKKNVKSVPQIKFWKKYLGKVSVFASICLLLLLLFP